MFTEKEFLKQRIKRRCMGLIPFSKKEWNLAVKAFHRKDTGEYRLSYNEYPRILFNQRRLAEHYFEDIFQLLGIPPQKRICGGAHAKMDKQTLKLMFNKILSLKGIQHEDD